MSFFGFDPNTLYYLGYTAMALAAMGTTYYYTTYGIVGLKGSDLNLIAQGLLTGALHAEKMDDILKCLTNSKKTLSDFEEAAKFFQYRDYKNVLLGIEKLGVALSQVAVSVEGCSGEQTMKEMMIFKKMVENFETPKKFAMEVGINALVNGVDIYHEMSAAYTNYQAKEYEAFGRDIGVAMALVLIGAVE